MARAIMDTPTTRTSLPTPGPTPTPTATGYSTPISDIVMAQITGTAQSTTFTTRFARRPYWARDITIGTLDDTLTISIPDDPVGTIANMDSNPTATGISPISTPDTAPSASDEPPFGGDLDKITDKICKEKCTPGGDFELTVWTNYGTVHNGTHIATNHTEIYCDRKCIAHLRTMTTSFDSADSEDAEPTTSLFTEAAAAFAAATSASAIVAGTANLFLMG